MTGNANELPSARPTTRNRSPIGKRAPLLRTNEPTTPHFTATLNDEQQSALAELFPAERGYLATLLQGITGSGKTEVYLAAAALLDAAFIVLAVRLLRESTGRRAALLFHYSLLYLALLFVAVAVGAAL